MALPPQNTTFQQAVKKSQEELEKAKKAGVPLKAVNPYQGPPKGSTKLGRVAQQRLEKLDPNGGNAKAVSGPAKLVDRRANSLPDYEAFKKYQSTIPNSGKLRVSASVIVPRRLADGTVINFGSPLEAEDYDNYLKSIGKPPTTAVNQKLSTLKGSTDMAEQDTNQLSIDPRDKTPSTDKDLTEQEQVIQQKSEQAQKKELAPEETITYTPQQVEDEEVLTTEGKLLSEPEDITATKIDTSKFQQEKPTKEKPAETYEASTVGDVGELDAAVGELSDESKVVAAQGEVSPDALAEAATAELDPRATVKYQLADLYKSIEEGEELPAWASPAVRKVSAIMAQRGLGSSSMASAAITQALMESGVAIAQQDANKYATLQLQNLTNRQQAAIQNATVVASMDMANLNNRQAAAVNNAKAFLSIDLQNLTNEQQSNTVNFQSQVQALLSDASQENAAKQFNAKSENELEQFFAELGAQIETSTLNRLSALEEYNVSQEDAVQIFNNQQKSQREQFNTNMRVAIDQSNTLWRRQINTANTAAQNEVNRQNVLTLTGMRQQALNDLWQLYKDQASWTMKISENREDRAHNAAMQASAIADNAANYNDNFNKYLVLKTIDNIFRPQKD